MNGGAVRRDNPGDGERGVVGEARTTRLVATLVLVPSLPLLLLSVTALSLFYLAPARFGALLARLPGETFIRTALFFAPATLFAVVVLAFYYAFEGTKIAPVEGAVEIEHVGPEQIRWAARGVLLLALGLSTLFASLWALSFIDPQRFDRLMDPLPLDRFLRKVLWLVPWVFFALGLAASGYAFERPEEGRRLDVERLRRVVVGTLLGASVPALGLSLLTLGVFLLDHERFVRVLARLPFDSVMRLFLTFAPAALLAVVLLAGTFLRSPHIEPIPVKTEGSSELRQQTWRSTLATWVFLAGLSLSAMLAAGIVGVVVFSLLR